MVQHDTAVPGAHPWREHPRLKGRFRGQHPDDLQVIVHDGPPRNGQRRHEMVWVRVTGMEGSVLRGVVLDKPAQLLSVRQGGVVQFLPAGAHPVMVSAAYLRERGDWRIHPCKGCGFSELFEPPSHIARAALAETPAGQPTMVFAAACPLCGGAQGLEPQSRAQTVSPDTGPSTAQTAGRSGR